MQKAIERAVISYWLKRANGLAVALLLEARGISEQTRQKSKHAQYHLVNHVAHMRRINGGMGEA